MASFLGNINWDKLADAFDYAGEMYRPGGSIAELERNKLAMRLLKDKKAREDAQAAAKARLIGGFDPQTQITWNTGRQAPIDVQTDPELMGAPRQGQPLDPATMMETDMQLADAQKRFAKQQQADLLQAFPEVAAASIADQFTPKYEKVGKTLGRVQNGQFIPMYQDTSGDDLTAWQKAQIERQERQDLQRDRQLGIMQQRLDQPAQRQPRMVTYYDEEGAPLTIDVNDENDRLRIQAEGLSQKGPSEGEKASAGYLRRMSEAEKILSGLESGGFDPANVGDATSSSIPLIGNFLVSDKYQKYKQAREDWVRAKLRKESGAVIGEEEMAQEIKTYFPQPGDSADTIKQKADARRLAEMQLADQAGLLGRKRMRELKEGQNQGQIIDFNSLPRRGQ